MASSLPGSTSGTGGRVRVGGGGVVGGESSPVSTFMPTIGKNCNALPELFITPTPPRLPRLDDCLTSSSAAPTFKPGRTPPQHSNTHLFSRHQYSHAIVTACDTNGADRLIRPVKLPARTPPTSSALSVKRSVEYLPVSASAEEENEGEEEMREEGRADVKASMTVSSPEADGGVPEGPSAAS